MEKGSGEERGLIVEVVPEEETHRRQELGIDLETEGKWARQEKEGEIRERENEMEKPITVEDLEGLEPDTTTTNRQNYIFEKLSEVPAVRDPREIETADRALETLANKPPHQLSTADRIWELAAHGGSTLASDSVSLDQESREKLKKTLRKNKLTDKTTLAF